MTAISAGDRHTCAVADGDAYCWGFGPYGRLGDGGTTSQSLPVAVATGNGSALSVGANVTAISAGGSHTCAAADGSASCWGSGWNLSDGTLTGVVDLREHAVGEPAGDVMAAGTLLAATPGQVPTDRVARGV